MGEVSENIKATFANMVQIYEETASLFLDVDDLMARNGHRVIKGSAIESAYSKSLNYPRWWVTHAGARYYVSEEDPWVARSIGVFFLDSRLEPTDPIIVLATMRGIAEEEEDEINPSWVLWDAWTKGVTDHSIEEEHTFGNIKKVERGKIIAIPLEKVADRESLEMLIVNPLLEMDWK